MLGRNRARYSVWIVDPIPIAHQRLSLLPDGIAIGLDVTPVVGHPPGALVGIRLPPLVQTSLVTGFSGRDLLLRRPDRFLARRHVAD